MGGTCLPSGIYLCKGWVTGDKSFIDEVLPYMFTLGVSIGVWTDHERTAQTDK